MHGRRRSSSFGLMNGKLVNSGGTRWRRVVGYLLATGGTMAAADKLVEQLGGKIIGFTCLIELTVLEGRKRLGDYPIHAVISY